MTADRHRHTAAQYRSKAAELRATANAEARALEEQADDLIRLACELERAEGRRPGRP